MTPRFTLAKLLSQKYLTQKELRIALRQALGFGDYPVAQYLIEKCKMDVTQARLNEPVSLLELAVGSISKKPENFSYLEPLFDLLLKAGADIHKPQALLLTVIQIGLHGSENSAKLRSQYLNIINKLIKLQIDVNDKDSDGQTALIEAAGRGDKVLCVLLLKAGADISARNKFNNSAISWAIFKKQFSLAKELIEYAKNIPCDFQAALGNSLINARQDKELVKYLLAQGADADATDSHSRTAIYHLAKSIEETKEQANTLTIARMLLQAGTNLQIEGAAGTLQFVKSKKNYSLTREKFVGLWECITTYNQEKQKNIHAGLTTSGLFPTLVHLIDEYALDHVTTDELEKRCVIL